MQQMLGLLAGAMVAGSVYLMLSRNLIRFIFGLVLASNAVNLVIFAAGRLEGSGRPPLIPQDSSYPVDVLANSLPQALILTAIVIGFALLAFVFILFFRTYEALGTIDTEAMTESEPPPGSEPTVERTPS